MTSVRLSAIWPATAIWRLVEVLYWVRKLQARVLAGDHSSAVDAAMNAQRLLPNAAANFETAEFQLLRCARACRRLGVRALGTRGGNTSRRWSVTTSSSKRGPSTTLSLSRTAPRSLVRRSPGSKAACSTLKTSMRKPSRSAHSHGFVHNEAIANERAGRFYAARGFEKIATCLPAGCPLLLSPLGSGCQGSTTRAALSADRSRRIDLRCDRDDPDTSRASRSGDRDQGIRSGIG